MKKGQFSIRDIILVTAAVALLADVIRRHLLVWYPPMIQSVEAGNRNRDYASFEAALLLGLLVCYLAWSGYRNLQK
jgi:hypothetical protein